MRVQEEAQAVVRVALGAAADSGAGPGRKGTDMTLMEQMLDTAAGKLVENDKEIASLREALAEARGEVERLTHDRCKHGNPMCLDCHGEITSVVKKSESSLREVTFNLQTAETVAEHMKLKRHEAELALAECQADAERARIVATAEQRALEAALAEARTNFDAIQRAYTSAEVEVGAWREAAQEVVNLLDPAELKAAKRVYKKLEKVGNFARRAEVERLTKEQLRRRT